jgi:hypothetical protein
MMTKTWPYFKQSVDYFTESWAVMSECLWQTSHWLRIKKRSAARSRLEPLLGWAFRAALAGNGERADCLARFRSNDLWVFGLSRKPTPFPLVFGTSDGVFPAPKLPPDY